MAEVREVPEVIQDPQFEHRGVFETIDSPVDDGASVTVVKAGYITNEDGPRVHHSPPLLGQHSEDILSELGYSKKEIAEFREVGAV